MEADDELRQSLHDVRQDRLAAVGRSGVSVERDLPEQEAHRGSHRRDGVGERGGVGTQRGSHQSARVSVRARREQAPSRRSASSATGRQRTVATVPQRRRVRSDGATKLASGDGGGAEEWKERASFVLAGDKPR